MPPGRTPDHPDDVLTQTRGPSARPSSRDEPTVGTQTVRATRAKGVLLRRCTLERMGAPEKGRVHSFDQARIRIGAHATNELALAGDPAISRHHAELQFTERGYLLVDLKSTNGTYLDGHRTERAYLSDGVQLRIGDTKLLFRGGGSGGPGKVPEASGELGDLVGASAPMRQLFGALKQVAPLDTAVVVQGEPGTGKEHVARTLHERSLRRAGPLVVLDLEAHEPQTHEAELLAALEKAEGGTLVLDGILSLGKAAQGWLEEVLKSKKLPRVGGKARALDVRTIALSRADFARGVRQEDFLGALFQRLATVTLSLPPLRERKDDIRALADRALEAAGSSSRLSPAAVTLLEAYAWPGNVRELFSMLAHVKPTGSVVTPEQLPERLRGADTGVAPPGFNEHLAFKDAKEEVMESFEKAYLARVLGRCEGNVARAAKESGLHRKSLERLVRKHRIDVKALKGEADG